MENYEERYKEALERAKKMQENSNGMILKKWLWGVFPELKECEDEKIRGAIIHFISHTPTVPKGIIDKKTMLAWLEKQKDYIKFPNSAYTSNKDVIEFANKYSHTVWGKLMDNFKIIENYSIGCNDVSDIVLNAIINTYNWLEKQGKKKPYGQRKQCSYCQFNYAGECKGFCQMKRNEQKPIDKVESKFHEGEWITNGYDTWKIVGVKPLDYILQSQDGNIVDDTISYVDEQFHSFTIEDAKDGDVLVVNNEVFIYAHRKQMYSIAVAHCFVDSAGGFYLDGEFGYEENGKTISPATKEQRDLLFQKMKEAGYEWDADKKELKNKEVVSKENEEERIREQLCDFLRDNMLYQDAQYFISWLEGKKKPADEVMKIRQKAYSDGYMHGQANIAISLGKESVEALEHFVRSIGESGYASPYDNRTKLVYRLLEQLKQIVK